MNTTTAPVTATAVSASTARWAEGSKVAAFQSGRGFCVRKGGAFLSFNGSMPSVWDRKSTAVEIATTMVDDGTVAWIEAL